MEEKQSRIRWDDEELGRLAAAMAPRLLAEPQLHPLEAVRAAQDCLTPERRRELKAWSLVEARLQPRLDEAMARLRAQPGEPPVEESPSQTGSPVASAQGTVGGPDDARQPGVMAPSPAGADEAGAAEGDAPGPAGEPGPAAQAPGSEGAAAQDDGAGIDAGEPLPPSLDLFGDRPALQAPVSAGAPNRPRAGRGAAKANGPGLAMHAASMTLDPTRIETALVAALQSPVLEEALVELFSRTLAKALLKVGSEDSRQATAHPLKPPNARRVLLAGFAEPQQKTLMDALGESFDVRSWKPANGPQAFQALARLCRVVVFPEEADDEAEAGLKDMDVRVIRHAGSASRLVERLGELD